MILSLIIRRMFFLVFVLIALSMITFTLMRLVPSDPARNICGPRCSPDAIEKIREEYGLNDPMVVQYVNYITGVVRFDFGDSLTSRRPVSEDLKKYLPATLELTLVSMLIALVIGSGVGIGLIARHGAVARKQAVPFGPFLAIGAVVGLLAGDPILDWYLDSFVA